MHSSLKVPSAEPGSCEDCLVERPACRAGFMGKAVVCIFHLEGRGEGGTNRTNPPVVGSHTAAPALLLDVHAYSGARVWGTHPQTHLHSRPAWSGRTLRAEVTRNGGGGGDRGWSRSPMGHDQSL